MQQEEVCPSFPEAWQEGAWQHLVFLWRLVSIMFASDTAPGSKS